jgi:organic hydroperoxide reductase OsmC/OhrA
MRKLIRLVVAACFCLSTSVVLADQYFVVKDKSGKCKIEVFRADKGTIIAGPYDSKDEVTKALQDKCPDSVKKPAEKKKDKK